MKRLTLICTVAALGGCTLPPLDEGPGPLEAGFAPAYQKTSNGTIVARACRQTAEPGFGNLPPRCATSLAYAAHAAHPHDLVHPRHAGPAISNPSAVAANQYLFAGEEPAGAGATDNSRAGRVPLPEDAQ